MSLARETIYARAEQTDFSSMSSAAFADWIDRLPFDEFMALIALTDEHRQTGALAPPKNRVNVKPLEPHGDSWIVYAEEGALPLAPDVQCWVLFPDGETGGPNRADAFLWGGDGQATILAYAVAAP